MKYRASAIFIGIYFFYACSAVQSQEVKYFEGKLTFKNEFQIKSGRVDSIYLRKIFGKSAVTYLKEGNILEKYEGGNMSWQIYNRKENKTYLGFNHSDTIHWFGCGSPGQKMLRYEIKKGVEKILGILCDQLTIYYNNKIVTFSYNSDTLRVNPEWYRDFTLLNKNFVEDKIRSVYLKYQIEYPDFIASVTATSISWQKVSDTLFQALVKGILVEDK